MEEDNTPPLNRASMIPPQTSSQNPLSGQRIPVVPKPPDQRQKTLRTYESDVADLMAKRNTSSISMAIAESKRAQGTETIGNSSNDEQNNSSKKIIIVVVSLLLVLGGIFGAYYLYSISPLAPKPPVVDQAQNNNSLIPVDSQTVIEITATNPVDIQKKVKNELAKDQAPNTIRELALVTASTMTGSDGKQTKRLDRIPTQTMIVNMGINVPDILYRSMGSNWLLGVYANGNGQKSIFVVVSDDFYQNTFSGMLQWESLMADDLKNFLTPPTVSDIANLPPVPVIAAPTSTSVKSTSTATSTLATTTVAVTGDEYVSKYFALRGQFSDKLIRNKDIREFNSVDGKVVFLYSFIDNNRLLFTIDEALVTEIMQRLERQAYVR